MTIERVPVSLPNLIDQVERLWAARAEEKGLRFLVELDDASPAGFMGDPSRLQQVLFNLVSNAVKFTDRGNITLKAAAIPAPAPPVVSDGAERIVDRGQVEALRLEVIDTGVGISDAVMARLFNPFVQADASTARRYGGTGLGLAICKRLIEAMGGSVSVDSRPGHGSTFSVVLPLERVDAPASSRDQDEAIESDQNVAMRVLLVEDNPVNQKIAASFLNLFGVAHATANDGAEAVKMAGIEAFDAILMDVQMPVMDGLEATALIRAGTGPNADIPIIGLTADAFDEQKRKGYAAGMSDYLTKPIDPRALAAALAKAMAGQTSAAVCRQSAG